MPHKSKEVCKSTPIQTDPSCGISHYWNLKRFGVMWSGPGLTLHSSRPLHGFQHLLGIPRRDAPLLLEHLFQSITDTGWHLFGIAAGKKVNAVIARYKHISCMKYTDQAIIWQWLYLHKSWVDKVIYLLIFLFTSIFKAYFLAGIINILKFIQPSSYECTH